jgi:regulator of sigma E protease
MAVISVNLGLINLFPIPVLDGGHVVFFVLEILSRRQLSEKVKMFLFKIGFSLLVALMIFATWNDIVHLINRLFD